MPLLAIFHYQTLLPKKTHSGTMSRSSLQNCSQIWHREKCHVIIVIAWNLCFSLRITNNSHDINHLTCEHVALFDKWCLFCAHSTNYLILLAASNDYFVPLLWYFSVLCPFLPVSILFHSYSPQLNQFFILKFSTFYCKYWLLSPTIGHVPISMVVLFFTANVLAAKLEVDFGIFSRITLVDCFILMQH